MKISDAVLSVFRSAAHMARNAMTPGVGWLRPMRLAPLLATDSGGGSGQDSGDTVTARRRRPTGPSAGPRERADAPERRRDDSGGASQQPTSQGQVGYGSGGSSASGGQQPTRSSGSPGCSQIVIGLIVVAVLAVLGGPSVLDQVTQQPDTAPIDNVQPVQQAPIFVAPTPTRALVPATIAVPTPVPTTASSSAATSGQKWLIMLYQDADDKVLEQDIYVDLNEAERVGSTDRVQIVAQIDRYKGAYAADGDWTGTRRFYITKDNDLTRLASKVLAEGEVNMSNPQTLVDFATWAMKNYPADKYVLILSDHGMGWPGGITDKDPASGSHDRSIPVTSVMGEALYLQEMDKALQQIRTTTGLDKFEMVGLDACLMSQVEVLTALAPHARYATASQETEPSLGWAYTSFLQALQANPNVSGAELGKYIVQSYIQDDQRIVDDQARAEMLGRGSGSGLAGLFGAPVQATAAQVAQQMEGDITMMAADLSRVPTLLESLDALAMTLQSANLKAVAQARTYAQTFTSVWGTSVPPSYVDLGNFVELLKKQGGSQAVVTAADRVLSNLDTLVIAEKHGPNKPGANGVSIYFPNSQLYANAVAGAQSYTAVASRFVQNSLWDELLAYFYTGQKFQASTKGVAVPDKSMTITAPAAGKVTISAVQTSGKVAAPGQPVTLTADISGQNIGYIYLFAGYIDKKSNSIFVADIDYLDSATTREAQGVYYPDWGSKDKFKLQFAWEPLMFAITDGTTSAVAMLKPERYGASPEDAQYSVDGIYTFADSGDMQHARLYFSNGYLRHVYGFTSDENSSTGAPAEITPQKGDSFTILEQWMDQNTSGKAATTATQTGKTLTFMTSTFTWKVMDAAIGDYVVGFIVEDLDGNKYEAHTAVTVK